MDKRKVLSRLLPIVVLISVSITAGVTDAAVIHFMQLGNPVKTPVIEEGVTEGLNQGAKKVSFTNNGGADVFLRAAFAQSWAAQNGTVLPSHITGASGQSLPVAVPSLSLDGNWESGEDGWYYYKRVLPGSTSGIRGRSMGKLVRGVDFIELSGIEDQQYQNTEYQFHFTMEIVQSSGDWNISRRAMRWLFDRNISAAPDNQDDGKYGCSVNRNADSGENQEVAVLKRLGIHPWLKNKKTADLPILVILLLSFTVMLTYYSDIMTLANPLGTSHNGAVVMESFDPENPSLPGETMVKKVSFQNTGRMDLFLRAEVPPQENWYQKEQGGSPPIIPEKETGYDTAYMIKHWNPEVWTDSGQEEGNADYINMETAFWSESYADENGKSYRYYKQILPAERTTDCILENVSLSDEVSDDRHDVDYSDKIYKPTFHAGAIPVEGHDPALGVRLQWNMVVQKGSSGILTWSQGSRAGK